MKEINILGMTYHVEEVDCVNKFEPRKGEINFMTNEIRIDKSLPKDLKEQTLLHEIIHAICDLLGMDESCEDETKVQGLATALHQVLSDPTIFSF